MLNRANIQIVGLGSSGGGALQSCLIDIGDWNMDTTEVNPSVDLYWSNIGICAYKVVDIQATIRADANVIGVPTYSLGLVPSGTTAVPAGSVSWTTSGLTSGIVLQRKTGGFFDNNCFDSTSYNRGWAIIQYSDAIIPPPVAYKDIDMLTWSTTGSEGGAYQDKCTCIYSTPAMSTLESYCLAVDGGICMGTNFGNFGSYGCIRIDCNASPICSLYLCTGTCTPLGCISFPVVTGDVVNVYTETSIDNALCPDSICAYVYLNTITSISGSFQEGTTCTDVYALAGQGT